MSQFVSVQIRFLQELVKRLPLDAKFFELLERFARQKFWYRTQEILSHIVQHRISRVKAFGAVIGGGCESALAGRPKTCRKCENAIPQPVAM